MRYILFISLLLFMAACNQNSSDKSGKDVIVNKDSVSGPVSNNDSATKITQEARLMSLSVDILKTLKNKNLIQFAEFIHPQYGVRFSPYGHVDTLSDQVLSKDKILSLLQDQKKVHWGSYDGSGDPIRLTLKKYFDEFVYDADFLNAGKKAFNKYIGTGNTLNNLDKIYPGGDFIEFHFPGFDPQYGGMDWKSLRLVFRMHNATPYLVGVVHDEWTI